MQVGLYFFIHEQGVLRNSLSQVNLIMLFVLSVDKNMIFHSYTQRTLNCPKPLHQKLGCDVEKLQSRCLTYYEYHVWVRLVTVCIFTGKVSKVCRQQIFVRNMKTLIPLVIVLIFTLFAISEALFFGVPRSSCTHDYQCPRTRKCVRQGNPVCGISS